MSHPLLGSLIKDTRIAFDQSILKMPMPSSAFLRRIRETVDFGHSTYAHEAMTLLHFLPFKLSREENYDFMIRINKRSHYYSEANAMRHIYNILFVCLHPSRPTFDDAHPTIREIVLLAYCNDAHLAVRVLRGRWDKAMPYARALEYSPDLKLHLLVARDIHIITQSVDRGDPFTVDTGAKIVLALRVMFNKAVQTREGLGFNHEYADLVFDVFLTYVTLHDEPKEPGFSGKIEVIGNSRYASATGPGPNIFHHWSELVRLVQARDGAHWSKAISAIQKLMYEMASGVARVFNFIAKRVNYAQYNASQTHTQEEVAFARDFATACLLVNKLASLQPTHTTAERSLQAPPSTFADMQRKQMMPRNMADFYTVIRLFHEQVFHFLHRSLSAHVLQTAEAHPHGCVWILVRNVSAERLRAIIDASMTHRDMGQFVLHVGEMHDPNLGFGSVVGLRCWYDGESAKTDAISLFSLVLTTKVRARNFAFPGYTVPVYPFVARLLLNMPMNNEWAPAALALGVLPSLAVRPYTASYECLKKAFRVIGMTLFLAVEKPGMLLNAVIGRFINNMLWHLGQPHGNNLIILHEDMPRVAKAVKKACLATPSARGQAKKFLVFLNEEARKHKNRGYTTLGVWTAFLTYEMTLWMSVAQRTLLASPGRASTAMLASDMALAAKSVGVFIDCVRREPRAPRGRRVSLASGSEPSTPRQTKIGMLPYSTAGNASALMSPLVRRSSTPTHERGPFRSFNPDFKSELDLPFGRMLGLIEYVSTVDNAADPANMNDHVNDGDYDLFDVRTTRLDLIPFHQTALCMVSPLTAVGLPELDNLSPPLENGLDWCISSSAAASIYRHQRFKPEYVQLQEDRNKNLWSNYGTLEDMINEDIPQTTPPSPVYARPEPVTPVRPPLSVQVPPPQLVVLPDQPFGDDSDDEDDDPSMWSSVVGRPNPIAPINVPLSPIYQNPTSPTPTRRSVVHGAAAAAAASTRKRQHVFGSGLASRKKAKHHTRPTHNHLSPEQRRRIADGTLASSIPRTLAQVAHIAESHHAMKLCLE